MHAIISIVGNYDLSRMGWQQFEQMIQALAHSELGNGVTAFGAGRDGRRDASFNGRVNFPRGAGARQWKGYGVVQAKYKERVARTGADTNWFLGEVKKELEGWLRQRRLRNEKMPAYLLFATNVPLSGVEGAGGKDAFQELMRRYADVLGLKGWFAWDYNQIRVMLDNHPHVRRTYLEQILAGDILARLERLLPESVSLTARTLAVRAGLDLADRQWVRVGDYGYKDGSKLRLAEIAIDLPCIVRHEVKRRLVAERVPIARYAVSLADGAYRSVEGGPGPVGLVLVGSPGQGKSTIAQLIAHNYRAAFITDAGVDSLTDHVDRSIRAVDERLRKVDIPKPIRRRWPVFVELSKLGAALTKKNPPTLLEFLAQEVVVRGERVTPSSLLEWFSSWPCILILDGLDEVPNAIARDRVISEVRNFVVDVTQAGGDLFVLATTRPQGYQGEFDDAFTSSTVTLDKLTEYEALSYSDALVALRAEHDPDLAAQITERLLGAANDKVTSHLLSTPLQVTIMTALAERAVELPSTRFELFSDYYDVIFDREIGKPEGKILKKLRPHVHSLHERAGLLLQKRDEALHSSASVLTSQEVRRVLGARLRDQEFNEEELGQVADDLLRVSTNRLVLLVARTANAYGFEVRSIREYMAARALTEGADDQVLARLAMILPAIHWRNTWLFAAARILQTREHLAPAVVQLLNAANVADVDSVVARPGTEVAVDLYLDDVALSYPGLRRQILDVSLLRLDETSSYEGERFRELIKTAINESPVSARIVLDRLDGSARRDASSIAAKILHANLTNETALGDQARATLSRGLVYSHPREREDVSRSFMLGSYLADHLALLNEPDPYALELATILKSGLTNEDGERRSPRREISATSAMFGRVLDAREAREALVDTIRAISVKSPDVADYGRVLLRAWRGKLKTDLKVSSAGVPA